MPEALTIALPKGKLGGEAINFLAGVGLPTQDLSTESRRLVFDYPAEGYRYLICRPTDIPTYVEYGAADLGIVGKDTIVEAAADVFELVDLKFGFCRFMVALPQEEWGKAGGEKLDLLSLNHCRVATKFPRVAREYFTSLGMQVEVIKLHGNIELAPRVGLAEMIVDIVSTGRTLQENGLVPVAEIFTATARLIANRVSFRLKHPGIQEMAVACKRAVGKGGGA